MTERKAAGKCFLCGGTKFTPTSICFSCSKEHSKQTKWIFFIQNSLVGIISILLFVMGYSFKYNLSSLAILFGIPALILLIIYIISLILLPRLFLKKLQKTVREQIEEQKIVKKYCQHCKKAQQPINGACPDCGNSFGF